MHQFHVNFCFASLKPKLFSEFVHFSIRYVLEQWTCAAILSRVEISPAGKKLGVLLTIRPRKLDSVMLVTSSVTFKVKSQSLVFGVQTRNQPSVVPLLEKWLYVVVTHSWSRLSILLCRWCNSGSDRMQNWFKYQRVNKKYRSRVREIIIIIVVFTITPTCLRNLCHLFPHSQPTQPCRTPPNVLINRIGLYINKSQYTSF